MKKIYEFFTARKLNTMKPDVAYGLCNKKQHDECINEKECRIDLCGDDEKRIAGYNPYSDEHDPKVVREKVHAWRKKQFKKCKEIRFIIIS